MGAVTLALIGFFMVRMMTPQMVPLFTDLSVEDSASIVKDLERQAIAYQLKSDGAIVLVAKENVTKLSMKLAESGLPKGGGATKSSTNRKRSASTTFIQNINHLRALEGELARTIAASIACRRRACTPGAVPERPLFSHEAVQPSASIVLKVRGALEAQQVRAIRHLVASAVNGLKPERVSVIDETGKLLADGAA